ncbi:MAG: hemolysin III [Clostridiales bacterium]|nr:MAG: hemolysin III [Clostridiales bacterium]
MDSGKKERVTPVYYPRNEEIFSAVSHGIGTLFGIFALVYMITLSACHGNATAVVASAIYGTSLTFLYAMSTLSHALTGWKAKKVFRVLDHITIYLLIAGTYTPLTLITLKGALGWVIFGIQWGIAIFGITLDAVSLNRFKRLSMLFYILMGWGIIFAAFPMIQRMDPAGLIYLLGGGLFYTGGIVFYRVKGPNMHAIWHLFVLIGSVLQFITVCLYVLPQTFS